MLTGLEMEVSMSVKNIFVILFFVLCFCGCGYLFSNNTIIVGQQDSKSIITLNKGQTLKIELDENPTTGYVWQLKGILDSNSLKLVKDEYKVASDKLGAGGKRIFIFNALGRGECAIEILLARPWEKTEPPANEFKITVKIKS